MQRFKLFRFSCWPYSMQCSANALPVIQDGHCPPSWICYRKPWTPCTNFVMIDLVVFKLNGFEMFGRLCLKVPFGPPKFVFFWEIWIHKLHFSSTIPQKAHLGVKPRVLSHKCFRSFHL